MAPVLEAVPNFSEGRNPDLLRDLVEVIVREGAEVLDWSSDVDHHRSVITFVGDPRTVEDASVAAARVAVARIDLREHWGVHPRIGAMDVLPFVPLEGLDLGDAARSARRVGARLAEEAGIPVYLYGEAAEHPRRSLAELRRGGYEALREGFPQGRRPDLLPPGWNHAGVHPTAGASCVGARRLLLAWNVYVEGLGLSTVKEIARRLRETGGGFAGLRALGLELPSRGRLQISMNLEDIVATSPFTVFEAVEDEVEARAGRISGVEVIGMIPDQLVLPAAANRLGLGEVSPGRLLSTRLARHLAKRAEGDRDIPCITERPGAFR